jgi:hypothetical protein
MRFAYTAIQRGIMLVLWKWCDLVSVSVMKNLEFDLFFTTIHTMGAAASVQLAYKDAIIWLREVSVVSPEFRWIFLLR